MADPQEGRDLPPHMRNRLVRILQRELDAEAEQFKPGRMHHNGPRRVAPLMDVQYARALLAYLQLAPSPDQPALPEWTSTPPTAPGFIRPLPEIAP